MYAANNETRLLRVIKQINNLQLRRLTIVTIANCQILSLSVWHIWYAFMYISNSYIYVEISDGNKQQIY